MEFKALKPKFATLAAISSNNSVVATTLVLEARNPKADVRNLYTNTSCKTLEKQRMFNDTTAARFKFAGPWAQRCERLAMLMFGLLPL